MTSPAQTFLIDQCIQEYNQYAEALGQSTWDPQQAIMRNPITDNQITHEIIEYGVDKSWLDAFGNFLTPESPGIDLLEVYCSADSQLTGQSIRQGLKAIHFGLNQGDLSYYECRSRLYDILFRCRPRHVGCHPSAKPSVAGIRFNASKISGNGPESC